VADGVSVVIRHMSANRSMNPGACNGWPFLLIAQWQHSIAISTGRRRGHWPARTGWMPGARANPGPNDAGSSRTRLMLFFGSANRRMSRSPSTREISSAGGNYGGNFRSCHSLLYLLSTAYSSYSVESVTTSRPLLLEAKVLSLRRSKVAWHTWESAKRNL
jgi:hypothetical protein